jgi:protein-export membrane protein SecD/preprotein translocase SecF subunit
MRSRSNVIVLCGILALTIFSIFVIWPGWPKRYLPDFIDYPEGPIVTVFGREAMKLGLDLNGGTYVLLEADTSKLPPGTDVDEAMDGAKDVIERRVNAVGIGETEISREGKNRLGVQLPGISPDEAADLIGKTALLEFKEPKVSDDNLQIICVTPEGAEFGVDVQQISEATNDAGQKESSCLGNNGESGTVVWLPATAADSDGNLRALTGTFLKANGAQVLALGQAGCSTEACVSLAFNQEGGFLFDQITGKLVGKPLAIYLDDELIGAPNVNSRISNGESVITGLSLDEAKTLKVQLNTGALPVAMKEIQKQEIDATLGENVLIRSVQAGLIGIIAVMIFMIAYYRLPGILASLALVVYTATVMMIFKLFPGEPITVTLAGIAGFVLSVGMAVDANVLVFERMKDELRGGRALAPAIEHGFDRAWSSIRDSNISTLITCAILYWFGNQFDAALVQGFAITLAVGVLVSMFSAIVVTRTFLRVAVASRFSRYPRLWSPDLTAQGASSGARTRNFGFDFVKRRGLYFLISALIILPGVISLIVPPSLKPGIEFSSGATITVAFANSAVTQDQVEQAITDLGHEEARVQRTGGGAYIIRLTDLEGAAGPPVGPAPPGDADVIKESLIAQFGPMVNASGDETNSFQNFSSVSEIVSKEIGRNAAIAIAFAALAILVYITWSFRNVPKSYRYGIAAVVAALHDGLFVLGMFSIFGKVFDVEISTMFITGLLTVIGFSVHDTIVVFDRIRENVSRYPDSPFDEVVNASLTETVARSINTSFTVLITVVALLLLGGSGIDVLLVTLLFGIVAGTYSSIFIASQILVAWEDGDFARAWRRIVPSRRVPAEAPG